MNFMMELSLKILNTDMEFKYFQMEISIGESISLVDFMAKESIFGKMVLIMMVTFQKAIGKVKENGNQIRKMEMCISGNTKKIRKMDKESITGIMVVSMKVLSFMILSKIQIIQAWKRKSNL